MEPGVYGSVNISIYNTDIPVSVVKGIYGMCGFDSSTCIEMDDFVFLLRIQNSLCIISLETLQSEEFIKKDTDIVSYHKNKQICDICEIQTLFIRSAIKHSPRLLSTIENNTSVKKTSEDSTYTKDDSIQICYECLNRISEEIAENGSHIILSHSI